MKHFVSNGSNVRCAFLDASKAFGKVLLNGLFLKKYDPWPTWPIQKVTHLTNWPTTHRPTACSDRILQCTKHFISQYNYVKDTRISQFELWNVSADRTEWAALRPSAGSRDRWWWWRRASIRSWWCGACQVIDVNDGGVYGDAYNIASIDNQLNPCRHQRHRPSLMASALG